MKKKKLLRKIEQMREWLAYGCDASECAQGALQKFNEMFPPRKLEHALPWTVTVGDKVIDIVVDAEVGTLTEIAAAMVSALPGDFVVVGAPDGADGSDWTSFTIAPPGVEP